jgi:hypothetical protein
MNKADRLISLTLGLIVGNQSVFRCLLGISVY